MGLALLGSAVTSLVTSVDRGQDGLCLGLEIRSRVEIWIRVTGTIRLGVRVRVRLRVRARFSDVSST